MCSSISGAKALKKTCLRFAIFNFNEKLQNIFEIGLRKCGLIVQKSLLNKKYFEIKKSETLFCCLYVKLATVKIWEQSNKFPLTCSSLKCPLLMKKLFRENSVEKIFLLRKQTPPTNAVNWVLRKLSQSALGKFTSVGFLVKFTRVIFNQPLSLVHTCEISTSISTSISTRKCKCAQR